MATYYVALNGNDANPGTEASPKRTVAAGVGLLAAGDTLYIRVGTYLEQIRGELFTASGTSWSSPITIASYPGEIATLRPVGTGNVLGFAEGSPVPYVVFERLRLDGIDAGGGAGGAVVYFGKSTQSVRLDRLEVFDGDGNGILCEGTACELLDLDVHGNGRFPGYLISNGLYFTGNDSLIRGGTYHDNEALGIRLYDSAFPTTVSANNVIERVRAYDNGPGIGLGGTSTAPIGGGILVGDTNNVVRNTLCYGNSTGIWLYSNASNVTLAHNTVVNNVGEAIATQFYAGPCAITNNILFSNGTNIIVDYGGTGSVDAQANLLTDPGFVNFGAGDWHLTAGSAARNTGIAIPSVTTDFEGIARPQEGVWDRGAYEYVSGAPHVPTTYYVAQSGDDTRTCAQATNPLTPKRTIANALSCLLPGDTLVVAGGIYTGTENGIDSQTGIVPSGTAADPITIRAAAGDTVTLRPPHDVSAIRLTTGAPAYLVLQDLRIDMSLSTAGATAPGMRIQSGHHITCLRLEVFNCRTTNVRVEAGSPFLIFRSCLIHDAGFAGDVSGGGTGLQIAASDAIVEDCQIYNNFGSGILIYATSGPHTEPSRTVVHRNRIYGNGRNSLAAYGVLVAWGADNVVKNNLIFDNWGGVSLYTESRNAQCYHNTIAFNTPGEGVALQYYRTDPVAINNILWGNGDNTVRDYGGLGGTPVLQQNLLTTPLFTSDAARVFTLQTGSPARDVGVPLASVLEDVLQTVRPQGPASDLGAYEMSSTIGPVAPTAVRVYARL